MFKFLIIIVILFFSFIEATSLDCWSRPYYLSDPIQGKFLLSNPAFMVSRDSIGSIQTTFAGPFANGTSLSSLEIAWPYSKNVIGGLLFAGAGDFQITGTVDTYSGGGITESESFNRGIFGGDLSLKVMPYLSVGTVFCIVVRDYSSYVENVPAYIGGIVYNFKDICNLGLTAGYLTGGKYPSNAEKFAGCQGVLKFFSQRLNYSTSVRYNNREELQVQNIAKIWVFKNSAIRYGYDPALWNIGCILHFEASGRDGLLEYYLGKGFYHHVHINLRLGKS